MYPLMHGIELADNGEIRKLRPEVVSVDPVAVTPGRIWYNAAEHKLKFSDLNDQGQMVTRIVLDEEEVKNHTSAVAKITEGIEVRLADPDPVEYTPGKMWLNVTENRLKYINDSGASVVKEVASMDDLIAPPDTRILVNQTAHGFSVLTPLYTDGTAWAKADASDATKLSIAVVASVIDVNTFEIKQTGRIASPAHGLNVGEYYYLSDSVPGTITELEPAISQPLYFVENADNVVALQYRPSVTPDPNLHQRVWKDLTSPLQTAKATGGTLPAWEPIGNSPFYAYGFRHNQVNEVLVSFHLGHDYALGTDLYPHIHWTAGDTGSGVVRWVLELAYAKGHQQAAFNLNNLVQVIIEQSVDGTLHKHYVAEGLCSNFTADLEPDGMILMRVYRDANHPNDTYASSAYALQADIHYQADMIGTANKAPNFYG